jgi:DNA-binding FadR family transcriptional regulator
MPLEHIGQRSVFHEIQLQIRNHILENNLKPGDLLPPAAELASRLGVSQATLREALRALEALGILEIKHGVGTVIRAYDLTPLLESLSFSLLFERDNLRQMVLIREAMEAGSVPEVVRQISDADLRELEAILEQMAEADNPRDLERQFHRTLYRCLDNPLLLQFIDIFWLIGHNLADRSMISDVGKGPLWEAHAPIVETLRARDANAAVQAIHHHFDGIKYQLNGWQRDGTGDGTRDRTRGRTT